MYCPRCGESNDEGNRFCTACGAELAVEAPEGEPKPGVGEEDPAPDERPSFLRRVTGTTRRERQVTAATLVAIVIAVIAFVLLDTPNDDEASSPFLSASDDLCVGAKKEVARASRELARSKEDDARQAYVDEVLDVVVRWRAAQRDLQPAPDEQADAAAYLAAMLDVSAGLADLSTATANGNEKRIAEAATQADEATGALETSIDELGLRRCGALSFVPASPA